MAVAGTGASGPPGRNYPTTTIIDSGPHKVSYKTTFNDASGEMKFPGDLGSKENPHFMMFNTFTLAGTVAGTGSDAAFIPANAPSVSLPVSGNPTATYDQSWDQETAGLVKNQITQAAGAALGSGSIKEFTAKMMSNVSKGADQVGKLGGDNSIVGAVAGNVLGFKAAGQSGGKASFDQIYAIYAGPGFRSFNFTYSLKAFDAVDVGRIDDIVKYFKINSAPRAILNSISRLYQLPKAFKITYHYKAGPNDWINQIGYCACTSVGVSYGGDRFTTFDSTDGAPVQVDLTLAFKELQLQDSKSIEAGY